jgi:beta-lactamase regulating signal transducer with metallopeptidase domain
VEFLNISYTFASYNILPPIDKAINKPISVLSKSVDVSILKILLIVWCAGSFILLLRYFVNYRKLCKTVKFIPQVGGKHLEILNDLKNENNFKFSTKIIQSPAVEFPAECGYFGQTIFINDYNYTDDELKCILLHELAHFRYGTNWINLFVCVIRMIFWWNPVVYLYQKQISNLIEMYVDSKVTKNMNTHQRCDYVKCIFKVYETISYSGKATPKYVTPLIYTDSDKNLLKRFELIKNVKKVNIPMCTLTFLLFTAYFYVSCKYVVQPCWECTIPEHSEEEIDFNASNSYIVEEDDGYTLYYNGESFLQIDDLNSFSNVPIIKKMSKKREQYR